MSLETTAQPPAQAPIDGLPPELRRWAVAAIFTALAMASLDTAIANIALPAIAADLHVSPADVVWVVNIYQIALVATLLPLGALGEIVGHQRIYFGGLLLFTVASLGCALAWSLPSLMVARALQGLGASGLMAVNAALVRFVYPTHMLGRGFGHNALVVGTAFTFGPTIASAILSFGTWPWLFAVNLPFGVIALWIGLKTLPNTPRAKHSFDFIERGADRKLPRPVHCRHRRRGAPGPARPGRTDAGRGFAARLGDDAQGRRTSGADAADRSVPAADVRAVGGHVGVLVRGAGFGFRLAAVLLRGRAAPVAGGDRLFHDAVAAGGGDHGADRRPAVRPLSRRPSRRPRPGAARHRHGAAGDAAAGARHGQHRLAHGDLRDRIWFLSDAQFAGADGRARRLTAVAARAASWRTHA